MEDSNGNNAAATAESDAAVAMPNGRLLPALGFGTWELTPGDETERAVGWALETGYRHLDTASVYRNEASVGRAMKASGLARDDVFITTKLAPRSGNPADELAASLERLDLDFIDLYLIHWPVARGEDQWPALEDAYEQNLAHAIGVSNFAPAALQRIIDIARISPMVNQVEWHPGVYDADLLTAFREQGVVVEGYSPLGHGDLIGNPTVGDIAAGLGRTPAQVLLRWSLQRGVPAIPRSSNRARIAENADVFSFTLDDEHMTRLDALRQAVGG